MELPVHFFVELGNLQTAYRRPLAIRQSKKQMPSIEAVNARLRADPAPSSPRGH